MRGTLYRTQSKYVRRNSHGVSGGDTTEQVKSIRQSKAADKELRLFGREG